MGFHDNLTNMYHEIKWLEIGDIDTDVDELGKIKGYISGRLARRSDIPELKDKTASDIVSEVIDADEVFLKKTDNQHTGYSNDEEMDFIKKKIMTAPFLCYNIVIARREEFYHGYKKK